MVLLVGYTKGTSLFLGNQKLGGKDSYRNLFIQMENMSLNSSLSLKFFGQSLFPYSYLVFKKADTLFKL